MAVIDGHSFTVSKRRDRYSLDKSPHLPTVTASIGQPAKKGNTAPNAQAKLTALAMAPTAGWPVCAYTQRLENFDVFHVPGNRDATCATVGEVAIGLTGLR
jgi:hypothetical protein